MKPDFNVKDIDIGYKMQIEKIRGKYNHALSSHTFVSLYLWRHKMCLSILLKENFFAAKCSISEVNSWFFPCGDEKEIYEFIKYGAENKNFSLCYLRESDVKWLEDNFSGMWNFRRTEESDEYICNISEYVSLNGSKFSEIRRKIRKLDRIYEIRTEIISEKNINDALLIVLKWREKIHNIGTNALTDEGVAEEALNKREIFNIKGIVMYIDNIPVSVFAGFPISRDTIDVVVGKCSPDAPKGVVYYALREYLKLCAEEYTYCNHEEDLGISGIRQMKKSLCPIYKISTWEAVLK